MTRSKVIGGQIVSYLTSNCYSYGCPFSNCSCMNMQVRSDYNQTWIIDALWEPSRYDALRGHMTRSKVIGGQIVSYLTSNCYSYGCPFSNCSCMNRFAPITTKLES